MSEQVQFLHTLLPGSRTDAKISIGFGPVSYEISGDADFVTEGFAQLLETQQVKECLQAALEEVTAEELVEAMRDGGFPEEQVVEFEKLLEEKQ